MISFENQNIEFKQEYVSDIRKEVIGFANADGGVVYVGIRKDGVVIGMEDPDSAMLQIVNSLKAGDCVYITGTIYTARDAAHKRMYEAIKNGENIPFELKNNIIYYLGPSPAREGQVIGSAGPTTSSRMDKYTPLLLEHGLKGMIGKGKRSDNVIESMHKNNAVYFAAIGGAGALLSKCIKKVLDSIKKIKYSIHGGK